MKNNAERLKTLVDQIQPLELSWIEQSQAHTAQLLMPPRALGRLHEISERLCAIQRTLTPSVARKAILVMAADHGVAAAGVSAYPQEVTGEMIRSFIGGVAGINAISGLLGADVFIADMGIIPDLDLEALGFPQNLTIAKVARGTANMVEGPAMDRASAVASIVSGFDQANRLFDQGVELLGTGDMGIGNTTASAAIGAVFTDTDLDIMVGRGTGVDDGALALKRQMVGQAIEINQPDATDGIDVLSKVGGFEIGGIAGSILCAAHRRRAVVIDGFISTAGALVAHSLCPAAAGYMFAGHCSAEPGHRAMLSHLGRLPILDLGMRLGEGTGAALSMGVIEAAVRVFTQVATFEQAGVSNKA